MRSYLGYETNVYTAFNRGKFEQDRYKDQSVTRHAKLLKNSMIMSDWEHPGAMLFFEKGSLEDETAYF